MKDKIQEIEYIEKHIKIDRKKHIILFILTGIIALLIILNAMRYYVRLDVSQGKIFSLSYVTEDFLKEIPEKVHITYYLSERMKTLYPQVHDVIDLLQGYVFSSKGMVSFSVIDPQKENVEQALSSIGIESRQIQTVEKNQTSFSDVYSALVIEYQGTIQQLPFVFSTAQLEFEVTWRLMSLITGTQKAVNILIANQLSPYVEYEYIFPWLESADIYYELINTTQELTDISIPLLVLGSSELSQTDSALIAEFVLKGGKALFAVSSRIVNIKDDWSVVSTYNTDTLIPFLDSWGIHIGKELVLDISNFRMTMQSVTENSSTSPQYQYINYPFWTVILRNNISKNNPITSGFSGLDLFWANPIYIEENSHATIKPLISSTQASWLMKEPFITDPYAQYSPSSNPLSVKSYPLAVSVEGNLPTSGIVLGEYGEHTRMILVADDYFPSTLIEYTNGLANMDFLINALLWLHGDDELLLIKNRGNFDMRLNKITDKQDFDKMKSLTLLITICVIPLLVCCVGFIIRMLRRKA